MDFVKKRSYFKLMTSNINTDTRMQRENMAA